MHFWIWFIVLTSTLKAWPDWRKLIWFSLAGSCLVGLYGLGQKIGLKILLPETSGQMTSTLGNPIFLASYVMLNTFLAGFLWLREKRRIHRNIISIVLMFNILIMFLAASRGVLLAFVLMGMLFCVYLLFTTQARRTKRLLLLFFIIFLIIIVSAVILLQTQTGKPWIVKGPYILQKITYFTSSIKPRTMAWQIAWQGFLIKPLWGWGWENYHIVFNKLYQPYYLTFGPEGTWFDQSHNQVMDLLATTGIIGTLAYLFFYGTIFYLLIKKMKRAPPPKQGPAVAGEAFKEKLPFLILILMFVAYFLQNLTVFDTPGPLIVFYFGLGVVYFVTTNYESTTNIQITNKNEKPTTKSRIPLPLLVFVLIILLVIIIYQLNLKPFVQSKNAVMAFKVAPQDLAQGLWWYQRALTSATFVNPEIRLKLFQTMLTKKSNDQNFLNGLS
ncbi:MAG: O-antigen ligase family protein, partial [Candidatus Parcubacteria bacterium]|nr:O-antigen ligase family protein [Candidatus Parcubacteria bacterium]